MLDAIRFIFAVPCYDPRSPTVVSTLIHVYIKLFFVTAALRIFVLFLITANVG